VGRHELLLLAHRSQESERVDAEADHSKGGERQQAQRGAERHPEALASAGRGEHQKRQHQASRELDAHSRGQRRRPGTQARAATGRHRQGERQREEYERVVVRTSDRQHQQDRIQPDEGRRPGGALTQAPGGARDQRNRTEAGGGCDRLEDPQPARESQRGRCVASEREQGAVGGMLEGPSHEGEDWIGGRFGGHVGVRIQAVQGTHAREGQIAEHVLGDQRRSERQDDVREHDRAHQWTDRQRARRYQYEQVARAHDQHQRLEAAAADADIEAL
jgi:hypothetical protein